MTRTAGAAMLCLVVAMAFVACFDPRETTGSAQPLASPGTDVGGSHGMLDGPTTAADSRHRTAGVAGVRQASDERYVVSMGDPVLAPRSEAEVAWLRRNAYPNAAAREDAARRASELDFDARDGIEGIEILAAEQFARQHPDNRERAIGFINEAAASGSIYALEALARLAESPADPVTAEAYYRAQALRGDWNAYLRVGPELTAEQDKLAHLLAHRVLENLQEHRRQRGLPELRVDQRPGLAGFMQQVREAEAAAASAGR
jgi:hypothetical protein